MPFAHSDCRFEIYPHRIGRHPQCGPAGGGFHSTASDDQREETLFFRLFEWKLGTLWACVGLYKTAPVRLRSGIRAQEQLRRLTLSAPTSWRDFLASNLGPYGDILGLIREVSSVRALMPLFTFPISRLFRQGGSGGRLVTFPTRIDQVTHLWLSRYVADQTLLQLAVCLGLPLVLAHVLRP